MQTTSLVSGADLRPTVARMAATLRHRGPDDAGTWADVDAGIALGHQRLAIIDLSAEGHQPMISASGRYVLVFNGEIYNFDDLRHELRGYTWRGHSDTEVMLAAFERWGIEESLVRFNGMFAIALWDRNERALYLARDRTGEKPLYYGWVGKTFAFGSELKALQAHPAATRDIDRDALAAFLRHNYVPGPQSIYRDISKLPAGQWLRVSATTLQAPPTPYWSMRDAAARGVTSQLPNDPAAAAIELDALLRDSVRMRMVADVPIGVFLSGGIDSSTVSALMQAQSSKPIRTFSIGFDEPAYDEAPYAKAVADHLGTDHTELYVRSQDALDLIPRLPLIYDEPFADASQIPTVLLSALTRAQVTVALSGDGGDELFCGYSRYFWSQRLWNSLRPFPRALRVAAATATRGISVKAWDALLTPLSPLMPSVGTRGVTGDRIHKAASVLRAADPDELYDLLTLHWGDTSGVVLGTMARGGLGACRAGSELKDFFSRMMFVDSVTYLPDDILVKVDRASMSVGLETRVPLLDHRVVEYAWRVPHALRVRNGTGKWLLREVLKKYVPPELTDRKKMGFGVPIDAWLRGPLREWAEELLSETRLRREGYFDPATLRRKWSEHLSGARNWEYWLWSVLMFQAWMEHQRRL